MKKNFSRCSLQDISAMVGEEMNKSLTPRHG